MECFLSLSVTVLVRVDDSSQSPVNFSPFWFFNTLTIIINKKFINDLQEVDKFLFWGVEDEVDGLVHYLWVKGLWLFFLPKKKSKELIWPSCLVLFGFLKVIVKTLIGVIISSIVSLSLIFLVLLQEFLLDSFIFLSGLFFHFSLNIFSLALFCFLASLTPFLNSINNYFLKISYYFVLNSVSQVCPLPHSSLIIVFLASNLKVPPAEITKDETAS